MPKVKVCSTVSYILLCMDSLGLLPVIKPMNVNHIVILWGNSTILEYYNVKGRHQ
jgi:hypothetical protein